MNRAYVLQLAFSLCLDTEADMQADITPNVFSVVLLYQATLPLKTSEQP